MRVRGGVDVTQNILELIQISSFIFSPKYKECATSTALPVDSRFLRTLGKS